MKIIIWVLSALIIVGGGYFYISNGAQLSVLEDIKKAGSLDTTTDPGNNLSVCTEDIMQCLDGSLIGRTGPNCEFVCPETDGYYSIDYPEDKYYIDTNIDFIQIENNKSYNTPGKQMGIIYMNDSEYGMISDKFTEPPYISFVLNKNYDSGDPECYDRIPSFTPTIVLGEDGSQFAKYGSSWTDQSLDFKPRYNLIELYEKNKAECNYLKISVSSREGVSDDDIKSMQEELINIALTLRTNSEASNYYQSNLYGFSFDYPSNWVILKKEVPIYGFNSGMCVYMSDQLYDATNSQNYVDESSMIVCGILDSFTKTPGLFSSAKSIYLDEYTNETENVSGHEFHKAMVEKYGKQFEVYRFDGPRLRYEFQFDLNNESVQAYKEELIKSFKIDGTFINEDVIEHYDVYRFSTNEEEMTVDLSLIEGYRELYFKDRQMDIILHYRGANSEGYATIYPQGDIWRFDLKKEARGALSVEGSALMQATLFDHSSQETLAVSDVFRLIVSD